MSAAIRRAQRDEARALGELQLRVALHAYASIFPPEAPKPVVDDLVPHWDDAAAQTGRAAFVAEAAGTIVGAVISGPDPGHDTRGHLSRLYVDPLHWGRGIGRSLHDACIEHLADQGFTLATLWVLEANGRAREWYERIGWQLTDARRPVYAPAGIDDVHYRLRLDA